MEQSNASDDDSLRLAELAGQSLWFSHHERKLLFAEQGGFPPYLKQLAREALEAEAQFRGSLAQEHPEMLQYMLDLKAWLANADRTAGDFPGWKTFTVPHSAVATASPPQTAQTQLAVPDMPAAKEARHPAGIKEPPPKQHDLAALETLPSVAEHGAKDALIVLAAPESTPKAWEMPVDSLLLSQMLIHPLSEFDEQYFLRLLAGSLSLSVSDKKRVIDAVPTLSQFQIDELTKVFEDERVEFTKLMPKEGDIIRDLDEQCQNDMAFLHDIFFLERVAYGLEDDLPLRRYLEIEQALLHFEVETADALAGQAFDPGALFSYEQWLKARKAAGGLGQDWLAGLVQGAAASAVPNMAEAVRLLIDLEQAGTDGGEAVLQRLKMAQLGELAWFRDYLESRFHAFVHAAPDAFARALCYAELALKNLPQNQGAAKGPLLLHYKRCLLLKGDDSGEHFLTVGCGVLGEYLGELSWLFGPHRSDFSGNDSVSDLLDKLFRRHVETVGGGLDLGFSDNVGNDLSVETPIQKRFDRFGNLLRQLGFHWTGDRSINAIEQAIAEARLADAVRALADAREWAQDRRDQMRLWGLQVRLWKLQDGLVQEIERLQTEWEKCPSAWNAWRLLTATVQLGSEGRAAALALGQDFVSRFWFMPTFHKLLFDVYHEFYTSAKHPLPAENALWRAVALGPAWGLFDSISNFQRWKKDNHEAWKGSLLTSLLEGFCQHGKFEFAIISAMRLGWNELALPIFLFSSRQRPYSGNIFNAIEVGFDGSSNHEAKLAANARALELGPTLDEVLVASSAVYFRAIARDRFGVAIGWDWALYRAALGVWHSPQLAWYQYSALLDAAKERKRPDLYLGAYYIGLAHGAEIEGHLDGVRAFLAELFGQGCLRLPDTKDCGWLSFLAHAVMQEAAWLAEALGVAAPGHWIYDILCQIDLLRSSNAALQDGFLAREAERRRRELCLRDDCLLFRWPQHAGAARQAQCAEGLEALAEDWPDGNYRQRLARQAADWQRRHLYLALSGGRIAHSHSVTAGVALPGLLVVIDNWCLASLAFKTQKHAVEEKLEGYQKEAFNTLLQHFSGGLAAFPEERRADVLGDWLFALHPSERKGRALANIGRILFQYRLAPDAGLDSALAAQLGLFLDAMEQARQFLAECRRILDQEYRRLAHDAYLHVLAHHALAGSEMFESFRTRIRHGWLISSLKDCFARFDLYNEGHGDTIFTPALEQAVAGLAPERRAGLEQVLTGLRTEFRRLVGKLDQDWLWLKDGQHPEGWLDFDPKFFDAAAVFERLDLGHTPPLAIINAICGEIDQHAIQCFANIQACLRQQVFVPLESRLARIADWLQGARGAILALKDGVHLYDRLFGQIRDARKEFSARVEEYCAWFAFQEQGVRDFTLPEIARLAWQVVEQVDGIRIRQNNIAAPRWRVEGEQVEASWLLGNNFSDLLEVFKILFQNIVYHACPAGAAGAAPVEIDVALAAQADGGLSCRIASTCLAPARIDVDGLRAMLADPARRLVQSGGKQGSGLATVQEILQHRLHGAGGNLSGPWLLAPGGGGAGESVPDAGTCRLPLDLGAAAAEGAACFVLEVSVNLATPGKRPTVDLLNREAPDVDGMARRVAGCAARVLIVEDQPAKVQAMGGFVRTLWPDCGIAHVGDMETAARMLSTHGGMFNLLLLDMSLPQDPLPDAALKSLAGLDVLKLMQIHNIRVPSVLVTQYSNWSSESAQNTRQFMEKLSADCRRDFPQQFHGAVRFSHTDLAWQSTLKTVIESIFPHRGGANLDAGSAAARLKADPGDQEALDWQARSLLHQGRCGDALEIYARLAMMDTAQPNHQAGLACAYSGLGQKAEAEAALAKYRELGGHDPHGIREQMVRGDMQQLRLQQQKLHQDEMMATLGQIAGGMAHEMFSPLAAIQAQVEYAKGCLIPDAPEQAELRGVLDEILQQKTRMSDLVAHLRGLARGDKVRCERVDLGTVLQKALDFQRAQLNSHGIVVQLDFEPHLPPVWANPLVLEQVFINLLLNARDALEAVQGEKRIRISGHPVALGGREWLRAQVEDNGPGVPDGLRERIFEPFFTTKDVGRGLGLGLSLARKSVAEYGGTVYLERPPAGGATFVVELPTIGGDSNEA